MRKRLTLREALRRLLADGQWHTHMEMRRVGGTRFGGRVHELRQQGIDHELRFRNGGWQYKWRAAR